jgi:hypothetical protein
MALKLGRIAIIALIAPVSGCLTVSPDIHSAPPVQFNFNSNSVAQSDSMKDVRRGAVSGMPQHMGFFYAVNPDCTSSGLVHTSVKTAAQHGTVQFANMDGYSSFPRGSSSYECNKKKSPGVEVVYTADKDFSGTDQFIVIGIGPKGRYMETHYTVNVVSP